MIAILCPTRGRPLQYQRMVESANSTVTSKITLLSCTNDEKTTYVGNHFPQDCPTVFMWNELAKAAMKNDKIKLFMLASDDIVFATPGWDQAIINHYSRLEDKIHVYHLQDSRDPEGTPHPVITREYMAHMGYFVPPIFLHWFVDTWTTSIAKDSGCFSHFKDFILIHDKPSDRKEGDATHTRIRNCGWYERDKAVNESCRHFLEFEKKRLAQVAK